MLVAAVNGATLKKPGLYEGVRVVLASASGSRVKIRALAMYSTIPWF